MSRRETYETKAQDMILPILERMGFMLVDLEYIKEGGNWYLRAYIDKEGGITIDDCEAVSREFGDFLDAEDFIADSYVLEISSPGLSRPLKKDRDFEWAMGREVEIRTYRALNSHKEFRGTLSSYDGDTVTISMPDGVDMSFARADIALARLAFDWE